MAKKQSVLGLASAIERGAKKRKQCRGELFEIVETGEKPMLGTSCALGAAYEGAFGTPPVRRQKAVWGDYIFVANGGNAVITKKLNKQFPALCIGVENPVNRDVYTLSSIIVNLNDDQEWSRERIARWLRRLKHV